MVLSPTSPNTPGGMLPAEARWCNAKIIIARRIDLLLTWRPAHTCEVVEC